MCLSLDQNDLETSLPCVTVTLWPLVQGLIVSTGKGFIVIASFQSNHLNPRDVMSSL